jgi:carboxymethylenebutenolidase
MDALARWLRHHLPPDPSTPSVVHGDFKLDNVMFDPSNIGRIVAVFDWEMSALGDPLVDLGILLAYWSPTSPPEQRDALTTVTHRPGYLSPAALVERYAARSGRDVSNIRFYEVFALFKIAVVIQQIFGMTDWVEEVTDEFAEAGYLAIAPDLLSGMGPNGGRTKDIPAAGVGQVIGKLPPDQITADLNAVADYAKKLPGSNGKVCVVGFSWGGSQCFRFATNRKDLSAAFVFYGSGPDAASIARIQAPVYGFYAGSDARINAGLPQTQEQMKAAGKLFEPVTYEGAAHGFMRAGEQPEATEANKKARAAAWVKLKALREKFK